MSDMIGAPLFPFSLPSDVPLFPDEINHTFFPVNIIELIVNFNPCVPTLTKKDESVQARLKSYLNT